MKAFEAVLAMVTSIRLSRAQITSDPPGGWMRVRGTTSEPVTVRSNANPLARGTLKTTSPATATTTTRNRA
jgi:hypothetical protein